MLSVGIEFFRIQGGVENMYMKEAEIMTHALKEDSQKGFSYSPRNTCAVFLLPYYCLIILLVFLIRESPLSNF